MFIYKCNILINNDTKLKLYFFVFPCPYAVFYVIIKNSEINAYVNGKIISLLKFKVVKNNGKNRL